MANITIFSICIFIPIYSIFIYPFLISIIANSRAPVRKEDSNIDFRSFHILICVFNEEKVIKERIKNLNELNYPSNKIKITFVSDGSNDNTNSLIKDAQLDNLNINLIINKEKQGKSVCQNQALKNINDEIVLYSDADVKFEKNVISQLNSSFVNTNVGCVTGNVIFHDIKKNSITKSKTKFWLSELRIRSAESKLGILPTASGSCMAVRRNLIDDLPSDVGEDCAIPLMVINKEYKVVFNDSAVTVDPNFQSTLKSEFRSKIRMTSRNLKGTIIYFPKIKLNNFLSLSISIISRKIFRWLTPYFLCSAFCISVFSRQNSFIEFFYYLFLLSFIFSLIGFILYINKKTIFIFDYFFSFFLINISFFIGVIIYLSNKKINHYRY